MLIILIAIAALLAVGIAATFVTSNRDNTVLGTAPTTLPSEGFTSPASPPPMSYGNMGVPEGAASFNALSLRIGATIASPRGGGRVAGAVHFDEDGWKWNQYLIDDSSNGPWWLSVEREEGLRLTAFTPLAVVPQPGSGSLTFEGTSYTMVESGNAGYTAEGTTDLQSRGSCKYLDYRSAGGALLGFQQFDEGEWQASLGSPLATSSVQLG